MNKNYVNQFVLVVNFIIYVLYLLSLVSVFIKYYPFGISPMFLLFINSCLFIASTTYIQYEIKDVSDYYLNLPISRSMFMVGRFAIILVSAYTFSNILDGFGGNIIINVAREVLKIVIQTNTLLIGLLGINMDKIKNLSNIDMLSILGSFLMFLGSIMSSLNILMTYPAPGDPSVNILKTLLSAPIGLMVLGISVFISTVFLPQKEKKGKLKRLSRYEKVKKIG